MTLVGHCADLYHTHQVSQSDDTINVGAGEHMVAKHYSEELKSKIRRDLCRLPSAASIARAYSVPVAFVQNIARQLPCRQAQSAIYDEYVHELHQYKAQIDDCMHYQKHLEAQLEERDIELARMLEMSRIHAPAGPCKGKERRGPSTDSPSAVK